jgi:hypothetical protein
MLRSQRFDFPGIGHFPTLRIFVNHLTLRMHAYVRSAIVGSMTMVSLACVSPHMYAADKPWPPPSGVPMTAWGKEISPDKAVLPEYPRPQMVRQEWLNLNGLWDYAITPKAATESPAKYDGRILVPFPVESVLSQVAGPRKTHGAP